MRRSRRTRRRLGDGANIENLSVLDGSHVEVEGGSIFRLAHSLGASVRQLAGSVGGVGFDEIDTYELLGGTLASIGATDSHDDIGLTWLIRNEAYVYELFGNERLIIRDGATHSELRLTDSSELELSYGTVARIELRDDATALVSGGSIGLPASEDALSNDPRIAALLCTRNASRATVSGGHFCYFDEWDDGAWAPQVGVCTPEGFLGAKGGPSEIELIGTGFEVSTDGGTVFTPASDGAIPQQTGILRGTLASGDPLNIEFYHAGATRPDGHKGCGSQGGGAYNGTIFVPEPGSEALVGGLALLAALFHLRRRGA